MKHSAFLQALAEAFLREIEIEKQPEVLEELSAFQEVWRTTPVLRDRLLGSDSLGVRLQTLRGCVEKKLAPASQNILALLLRENALSDLSLFVEQARRVRIERGLGREVVAITALPLRAEDRARLHKALVRCLEMPISLSEEVRPEVIGGIRLESGDWSWDTTIQHRLDGLIQHLRVS